VHGPDPDEQQPERPDDEAVEDPGDQRPAAVAVGASRTEEVPAVDRNADRPVNEERHRDRDGRKGQHVSCPPEAATAAQSPESHVENLPYDEVDREAVEAAGKKRPDCEQRTVDLDVVEERARNRRGEDRRDPGEPDDRAGRVLPCRSDLVRIVTQSGEDPSGALQDEERT